MYTLATEQILVLTLNDHFEQQALEETSHHSQYAVIALQHVCYIAKPEHI